MQPDLTLGASSPARSRRAPDETVAALSLGERVLLSLGIQAVCIVVQAAELFAGEGRRTGHGRAVLDEARLPSQTP
jgi:hypothetical protein